MMGNPLFNQFGSKSVNPMSQFLAQFNELKQVVKNPKQEVERLIQSGQMSQEEFSRLSQMANQIMGRK